jgi:hypothetical protein
MLVKTLYIWLRKTYRRQTMEQITFWEANYCSPIKKFPASYGIMKVQRLFHKSYNVFRPEDGGSISLQNVDKLLLCHEEIWRSGGVAPPFLILTLDVGKWSASRPCHSTPGEIAASSHWIWSWVGSRAGLNALEKIKILPLLKIEPQPSSS